MLTPVERVLILKGADLLKDVGPRHLLGLADVAREIDMGQGDIIYGDGDAADALYLVVEGRVRLTTGERVTSEVGPGEAFGTWALVDDAARGHRAECTQDGLALALHRDDFYDIAAGDLTLLKEVVRVLAKRLRALVVERPEEARVEGEGVEKPEAMAAPVTAGAVVATETAIDEATTTEATVNPTPDPPVNPTKTGTVETNTGDAPEAPSSAAGASLKAAALGQTTRKPPDRTS